MTDWIGETVTSDLGWEHLETLVDVESRMAGTPGEREALEATRDALSAHCRSAHLEEFDVQGWVRGESEVRAAETSHDCIALPRSPAGTARGRLVDLGDGLPADFEADLDGAVVMVSSTVPDHHDRFVHRREKYYRAVEAGAAAFVFRNHVEGCLPPTGSVGTEESPIGEIPAVGVSKETGCRLARRFEDEEVSVSVACETPAATSANVHADVGPDTGEAVLLTSHVDAHDVAEGAVDNGAGTAMVLEVARALASRGDLDTRVHVVCFGAEEVGLQGSKWEAGRRDLEQVRAVVNCDGVVEGRTLRLVTHGSEALERAAREVGERLGHPVSVVPRQSPHSDHWPFVWRGVPAYLVGSETGRRDRGWAHTPADTLDKLDRRTLREQAVVLTELVTTLAEADRTVDRLSPESVAAALEAHDQAEGLKVTGDWPY